jgi:hypothetical protein
MLRHFKCENRACGTFGVQVRSVSSVRREGETCDECGGPMTRCTIRGGSYVPRARRVRFGPLDSGLPPFCFTMGNQAKA